MKSMDGVLSISEVNALTSEQFELLFGNIVEECPEAARIVASRRPFPSSMFLKKAFESYLEELSIKEKEEVLLKHPDITAILTNKNETSLTLESHNEQKSAGIHNITKHEQNKLKMLIDSYREKFQFPFVICMRENKIPEIIEKVTERIKNTRDKELHCNIQEVKKICNLRIDDIV